MLGGPPGGGGLWARARSATEPRRDAGGRLMATRPRGRAGAGEVLLRSLLWLVLGGWVGSWAFFALVIARVAFQVLPSAELAGRLVGPVLATLHWYGAVAGVVLAGLATGLGRGRLLVWLPLALTAACLVSELGITPQLAGLRDLAFGPDGSVEAARQYRQLHAVSMSIFSLVLIAAIGLVALHARDDAAQTADSP